MKNTKTFRKGNIVKCGTNVVLVTGRGNKNEDYPVFAGVVIMAIKTDGEKPWSVGMYSSTWSTEAFKKIDIKLSNLIADAIL